MSSVFDVERTPWGARVSAKDLRIEARGISRDGIVRATVSVTRGRGGALIFTDRVNLSSARSRDTFLKRLQKEKKRTALPGGVLLALEETIRTTPPPARPLQAVRAPGPDISGTPPASLEELERLVGGYLLLNDVEALRVLLAVVAVHDLPGDPVWLMLVGPPSGAKTELLRLLGRIPRVFPLSELTARTFASGLTTAGEDPSLLRRLTDQILVHKDFTSVLELHRDERQAILAQLRELYDGSYVKVWGTGKELRWEGRLGFLAGVTPVIDNHHAVMAVLGQRFLLRRVRQPDRQAVGRRAMRNVRRDKVVRDQLAGAVAAFMTRLPTVDPEVSEPHQDSLAKLADFVARARSGVHRDGYRRELDYAPEPEMPPRLARQFFSLARGLARVSGRRAVTDEDVRLVVQVGLDCLPEVRRVALRALVRGVEDLTTTRLAKQVQYATSTVRRALEDLQALGLVLREKRGRGDSWRLRNEWQPVLAAFLEMSGRDVLEQTEEEEVTEEESVDGNPDADNGPRDEPDAELLEDDTVGTNPKNRRPRLPKPARERFKLTPTPLFTLESEGSSASDAGGESDPSPPPARPPRRPRRPKPPELTPRPLF